MQRNLPEAFTLEPGFRTNLLDIYDYFAPSRITNNIGAPEFLVVCTQSVSSLRVFLGSRELSPASSQSDLFGDGTEWHYRFRLDRAGIQAIRASAVHQVRVDYAPDLSDAADFIVMMGPTLGGRGRRLPVPGVGRGRCATANRTGRKRGGRVMAGRAGRLPLAGKRGAWLDELERCRDVPRQRRKRIARRPSRHEPIKFFRLTK